MRSSTREVLESATSSVITVVSSISVPSISNYLKAAVLRGSEMAPSVFRNNATTYPHVQCAEDAISFGLNFEKATDVTACTIMAFLASDFLDDLTDEEWNPKWTTDLLSSLKTGNKKVLQEIASALLVLFLKEVTRTIPKAAIKTMDAVVDGFSGQAVGVMEFPYDMIAPLKSGRTFSIPGILIDSVMGTNTAETVWYQGGMALQAATAILGASVSTNPTDTQYHGSVDDAMDEANTYSKLANKAGLEGSMLSAELLKRMLKKSHRAMKKESKSPSAKN